LTALLSLRPTVSAAPAPPSSDLRACARRSLCQERGRAPLVPPASARSRERCSTARRFQRVPRASKAPLTLRVVRDAEEQAPPEDEHQGPPSPSSRQRGGCFGPERLLRASAFAFARFCNRERFTSTAGNRLDPVRTREVTLARYSRAASLPFEASLVVRHGSGESVAAFAATHPPPGEPGGTTPKPATTRHPCRSLWARPAGRADLAGHEALDQRAHVRSRGTLPAIDRLRGQPLAGPFSGASPRREAPGSRTRGVFERSGRAFRPPTLPRLLPTCG